MSINHDQIDRDGDVYEEEDKEEEEEERVVEEEKEKEEVSNEQIENDDIIFVKEYKKILASTKINKEYFYSEEFLKSIKNRRYSNKWSKK